MLDLGVFAIYRFLLIPIAFFLMQILKPILPSKIKTMIEDRKQKNLQHLIARPFWIHASSGEIEYAKSVIRGLKEHFPQVPIMVTYFSPSAKKLIQKFEGVDLALPLPWDTRFETAKFLRFYKPRALLIARTDVWPEMAYQTRQQKIPSLLFAATLAEKSSRNNIFSAPLTRFAFHCLDEIFCVSEADYDNFENLGVKTPLKVAGDTRFDQVIYRLKNPNPLPPALHPKTSAPTLAIGSSWPQDEEVIFPTLKAWCAKGRKVILASHEVKPERIENIARQLQSLKLTYTTSSTTTGWDSEDVLLVDQIGILQELYALAAEHSGSMAFVGGSFKDKVHSVMEPLAAGLPVVVGPYHLNNREALQFQNITLANELFAVNTVANSEELSRVENLVSSHSETGAILRRKVESYSGATNAVLQWAQKTESPNR